VNNEGYGWYVWFDDDIGLWLIGALHQRDAEDFFSPGVNDSWGGPYQSEDTARAENNDVVLHYGEVWPWTQS